MGSGSSKGRPALNPERGFLPTGKSCTFADRTIIDRRLRQLHLIDRAIRILLDTINKGDDPGDFTSAQKDIMRYKDQQEVDDPLLTIAVPKKGLVKYREHDWTILLEDPDLLGPDRRNPFEMFLTPLDENLPVDVLRSTFRNYAKRFNDARLQVQSSLRKECV
jgi:hypothetical protein